MSDPTDPVTPGIRCPKCGGRGPFRFLEDIVCYREVYGYQNGVLFVDSLYKSGEGYDSGENPRLECHSLGTRGWGGECLHEFPLPEELDGGIEWCWDDAEAQRRMEDAER